MVLGFVSVLLSACAGQSAPLEVGEAEVAVALTEIMLSATDVPATVTSTATLVPPTPTATLPPTYFCEPEILITPGHFLLARPIGPAGNQWIDQVYRYGHTFNSALKPHHGVEFVNGTGTPVLAAAGGTVVFSGWDSAEAVAEKVDFYGQVVVIEHALPGVDVPVFTLYGHLSEILVTVGEKVVVGQEISRVGMTGIATGEHLHFEVRVGENSYAATRNPELWLEPLADEAGVQDGVIAGYLIDENGQSWSIFSFVIEPIDPAGGKLYPEGYQGSTVNADDQWGEAFGIGELTPGTYKITFVHGGIQEKTVMVEPGMLTVVAFCLNP